MYYVDVQNETIIAAPNLRLSVLPLSCCDGSKPGSRVLHEPDQVRCSTLLIHSARCASWCVNFTRIDLLTSSPTAKKVTP